MKLIITEKPSVARDIARVLNLSKQGEGFIEGDDYRITWALGHLIELCQPDEYGESFKKWTMQDLPIIPETFKTKAIEQSKQQYKVVKTLLKDSSISEIICATDAGREGELIFRLLYEDAQCTQPIKRLWISSQTDTAIKEGFQKLEPGEKYNPLYDSAKSRSEADWIVGINATRAYSIKFSQGRGVMSVGRVQTPVLKMIVTRYREHIQFNSSTFYEILGDIQHQNGSFSAKLHLKDKDRFTDKKEAENIIEDLKKSNSGIIHSLTEKKVMEKQPLLYDLTEIQKDANKLFKYSADQTLKIMQSLYEKHKVLSYPRTSSRYLSKDLEPKLPGFLDNISVLDNFSSTIKRIQEEKRSIASRMIDDKKVTDHHAIIPTDKKPNLSALSEDEKNIYLTVIKRFVAAFLPECEKHHTEVIALFSSYQFKTTGTVTKKAGWRELYQESDEKKNKKDKESILPVMKEEDPVTLESIDLKKGQTKAPALYTEASILGAMETAGKSIDDEELRQAMKNCGLGTPATRAQILEKLINVKYIIRDKNKLKPTEKGEYIIDCIQDNVLVSPELTGEWEKCLNDIEQKNYTREDYMDNIKTFTKEIIEKVSQDKTYTFRADQTIYGDCPKCKKGKIIDSPKAYSCSEWKTTNCNFAIWKLIAQKTISETQAKTLLNKGKTAVIKGFKNKAGNPFNAALTLKNGEVNFDFHKESLGKCTLCDGNIVETPKAYSCDQWREKNCKFVIWKEISQRKIKVEEAKELIKHGQIEIKEGFKTRQGKPFSTNLHLVEGKVVFK
ncbi:DNA topoisomerase III [Candidatus Marinamargulisbacteria bacterium SCGC AG-343-D04]|nr:DNA topoisomerase III [Candidatus Marinamargulisbacteria bacterium SCGC AG-343-D04]